MLGRRLTVSHVTPFPPFRYLRQVFIAISKQGKASVQCALTSYSMQCKLHYEGWGGEKMRGCLYHVMLIDMSTDVLALGAERM